MKKQEATTTKTNDEILAMAKRDIESHLTAKQTWRDNYVKPAFAMYDGDQWTSKDETRQTSDEMPVRTINKTASVIDAVAGFEVQNRTDIDCLPLAVKPDPLNIETANNGVKWCESVSGYDYERSYAFQDLLKSGVGGVINYISYMEEPDGVPRTERIFPLLLLFDPASRRKNMKDARWVGYAEIVDTEAAREEAGIEEGEAIGDGIDNRLMDYFDTLDTVENLTLRYEYQWKEIEEYWRITNTALMMARQLVQTDQRKAELIARYMMAVAEKFGFNAEDNVFTIKASDYKEIKTGFEALGIPLKGVKQKRFNHFRAKILGNHVIDKGLCISPDAFDVKFMTGKYSEIHQSHYGMIHSMMDAQRMLNQTFSDFEGYLRTIPKGGVEMEETAVSDQAAFKATWHKAREITIYADGALTQGRVRPKQAGQMPQGIIEMIQLMLRLVPEIPGVTPDFMGFFDSGQEVSGILQAQRIRQGLTVLATYFDAAQAFTIEQGKLYLSSLRILAENAPGRLIRNVLGQGGQKLLELWPQNLASEYIIEVKGMPQTPNEQHELFLKLMELGQMLEGSQKTTAGLANVLPVAFEYSTLKSADKERIMAALQPPPPPQPDPVNQALIMAETNYKNSMAAKNTEDGKKTAIENLLKVKELESYDEKIGAEIVEIMSRAELNAKKADTTVPQMPQA